MDKAQKRAVSILGIYIAGYFLTFGYLYNNAECRPSAMRFVSCGADIGVGAGIGAFFWPIYWTGRVSIAATRWTEGF